MKRRTFVKSTAFASFAMNLPLSGNAKNAQLERSFKLCLNPGSIGVKLDQKGTLSAAIEYGYEAIVSFPNELANWSDEEIVAFKNKMKSNEISWGSTNLPVEFRKDKQTFQDGFKKLPEAAKALQSAGAIKMNTWIMPTHPSLPYKLNMEQHAKRLGECASVLADYGITLGLEYVGPKTLMARDRYPFIHTFGECMQLIEETGQKNVGIQLDSFHWFCGEDAVEDILSLKPEQIVTVDLNDARSDLSRDAQIDGTRELAGATGVIDIASFLKALIEIKYEGPVRSEPFNKKLNEMENEAALKLDIKSLHGVLKKSGINTKK